MPPLFSPLNPPVPNRRRSLLVGVGALALPWLQGCVTPPGSHAGLAGLESRYRGRLGLALWGSRGLLVEHRAREAFPACSTFKALLAALVLQRAASNPGLLERRVRYGQADLKTYAPVTARFVAEGMTVSELCAATVQYSDNVAANLLLRELGGPRELTRFARQLGDDTFRLDRWEPELNSAIPGDPRDTCTPMDMARNLHRLVLGDALPPPGRDQLGAWLIGNTTGDARIRAGMPPGWTVGDKTGTGEYGTTNDIAVLWPAQGEPLVLALYFTQREHDATPRDAVLAEATRLCFAPPAEAAPAGPAAPQSGEA